MKAAWPHACGFSALLPPSPFRPPPSPFMPSFLFRGVASRMGGSRRHGSQHMPTTRVVGEIDD